MSVKDSQTYKDGLAVEKDFKKLFTSLVNAPNIVNKLVKVLMARNMQRLTFVNHLLSLGFILLVYYSKIPFWLAAILIFVLPFISSFIFRFLLVKHAYPVVSILVNKTELNRHHLITFSKSAQNQGIAMHIFQILELSLFALKIVILFSINIYFVVIYVLLSVISLHNVKLVITAFYGEGVKHVKEKDSENTDGIVNYLFSTDYVNRFREKNRDFYYPQRVGMLFVSAFKNELFLISTLGLFFLFYKYQNIYFSFFEYLSIGYISIVILALFILMLLFFNWVLKSFFLTYFNVLFLWHTNSNKINVLIHSIIPVFSFCGRLNILINKELSEKLNDFYKTTYLPVLPKANEKLFIVLIRIVVITLTPLMIIPKIYGFLQHRFENTNKILSRDLNWKSVFEKRLEKTDLILFHIDVITHNVKWELEQLINGFIPKRILILTKSNTDFSGLNLLNSKSVAFINECHHIEYKDNYFGRLRLKLKMISIIKKLK